MLGSIHLRSPASSYGVLLRPATAPDGSRCKRSMVVRSERTRNYDSIPKLKPFSRTMIERLMSDPPFIEKMKNDLTDYCTTLEGEECCSCWEASFELDDMEKELPKEDCERFVRQASEGGMKNLIRSLHRRSLAKKLYGKGSQKQKTADSSLKTEQQQQQKKMEERESTRFLHIPDGLPKTQEEIEEEERAMMPDSAHTRLLRRMGTYPAWYTPRPDVETD